MFGKSIRTRYLLHTVSIFRKNYMARINAMILTQWRWFRPIPRTLIFRPSWIHFGSHRYMFYTDNLQICILCRQSGWLKEHQWWRIISQKQLGILVQDEAIIDFSIHNKRRIHCKRNMLYKSALTETHVKGH
jgi:hypothetical protein